jgi:hypothetical protein
MRAGFRDLFPFFVPYKKITKHHTKKAAIRAAPGRDCAKTSIASLWAEE